MEPGAAQGLIRVQLGGNGREIGRLVLHQVPGIGGEFVSDLVDKAGWPVEREFVFPPEAYP